MDKQEQAFQEWYEKEFPLDECSSITFKPMMYLAWQARQPEIDELQAKLNKANRLLDKTPVYLRGDGFNEITLHDDILNYLKSITK